MGSKTIAGIVMVIGGFILVLFTNLEEKRIEEGKVKIAAAKEQIAKGDTLMSQNVLTEELGRDTIMDAKQRVEAAQLKMERFKRQLVGFQVVGVALVVLGMGVAVIGQKDKRTANSSSRKKT